MRRAGSTTNSSTPSASDRATVRNWALVIPVGRLAAGVSERTASSALKLRAEIPSARASNSEIAPRTTGSPRTAWRRVIEANARSMRAIEPSARRTATATREGERIMTPSITA